MQNQFANNLKYYRKKNNLTQSQLAELLCIDRTTLTGYEIGKRECDFNTLIQLASILNTSTDNLLHNKRAGD